jgi:hypothetical protein
LSVEPTESTPRSRLQRVLARLSGGLGNLPLRRHYGALGALSLLHVTVFVRSLHGTNGVPALAIPIDFFNSYARFLIYISDCFRIRALPLWFPYGHAGTPFFMNPQSQLWSPVTWIVSLLVEYDPLVAQQQEFLFILFGSMGAYFLAHSLWGRRSAALLAAIAFNFTSARLCNAQHMDIVTAFSLFPWVFLGIRKLAQGHRFAAPALGATLGMLVVSGYPGVVLVSPLWFGGWAVWSMVTECPDRDTRKRFLRGLSISLVIGAGVSAGHWLPILWHVDAFTRSEPLTTDMALAQGLTPGDFWHLLYGASTRLPPDSYATDISMRGLYFGIVALALALYAVVFRRDGATTALGVGFLAALVMSLGALSFPRVALHECLHFLNLSRFPAGDSRAVASLAGSLLAGGGLAHLREDPEARRRMLRILVGLVVLMLVGQVWLRSIIYPFVTAESIALHFTNPVHVELFILGIAVVAFLRCIRPATLVTVLLLLAAFDSGTHASTDASLFAVSNESGIRHMLDVRSKPFDPDKALLPRVNSPTIDDMGSNDSYLNKNFYMASYTPFQLKRLHALYHREFQYFLLNGPRVVGFGNGVPPDQGPAFQQAATPVQFRITRYLPSRVEYVVDLPARTLLVFNEVYFPGWRARIDGQAAQAVTEVVGGLRGLTVEAGHHTIVTWFLPTVFIVGLTITMLSWLAVVVWLLHAWWRGRQPRAVPA